MGRVVRVAAAQLGSIQRAETRKAVLARLCRLVRASADRCADLVVFPELALTTFFPRWMLDGEELDGYFESDMPGPATRPLFELARRLRIGLCIGYAERVGEGNRIRRFNSVILIDSQGRLAAKYRKIHLPGDVNPVPERRWQHLERRYFETGDLGFPVTEAFGGRVGMAICYDRFFPETYRIMALAGVELILIGYNTPSGNAYRNEPKSLRVFQNHLCMQAGAHQNSCYVVGVAKAGMEDGHALMGGSVIIGPTGEILAQAEGEGDELVIADCDLDACRFKRSTTFDLARYREPEHYGALCLPTGGRHD